MTGHNKDAAVDDANDVPMGGKYAKHNYYMKPKYLTDNGYYDPSYVYFLNADKALQYYEIYDHNTIAGFKLSTIKDVELLYTSASTDNIKPSYMTMYDGLMAFRYTEAD